MLNILQAMKVVKLFLSSALSILASQMYSWFNFVLNFSSTPSSFENLKIWLFYCYSYYLFLSFLSSFESLFRTLISFLYISIKYVIVVLVSSPPRIFRSIIFSSFNSKVQPLFISLFEFLILTVNLCRSFSKPLSWRSFLE